MAGREGGREGEREGGTEGGGRGSSRAGWHGQPQPTGAGDEDLE